MKERKSSESKNSLVRWFVWLAVTGCLELALYIMRNYTFFGLGFVIHLNLSVYPSFLEAKSLRSASVFWLFSSPTNQPINQPTNQPTVESVSPCSFPLPPFSPFRSRANSNPNVLCQLAKEEEEEEECLWLSLLASLIQYNVHLFRILLSCLYASLLFYALEKKRRYINVALRKQLRYQFE